MLSGEFVPDTRSERTEHAVFSSGVGAGTGSLQPASVWRKEETGFDPRPI